MLVEWDLWGETLYYDIPELCLRGSLDGEQIWNSRCRGDVDKYKRLMMGRYFKIIEDYRYMWE